MSDVSDDTMTATAPRHTRRLSDKILIAFRGAGMSRRHEVL